MAIEQFLTVGIVMLVPITAIIASAWVRAKKLSNRGVPEELSRRVADLEAENDELRQRLENVEVIVSDGEWTPPEPVEPAETLRLELEEFANACAGRGRFRVDPEEALRNIAVMEAAITAARNGGSVKVERV